MIFLSLLMLNANVGEIRVIYASTFGRSAMGLIVDFAGVITLA
jgi:hypothetical protein